MKKYFFFLLITVSLVGCSEIMTIANLQSNETSGDNNFNQSLMNDYTKEALVILKTNCASCHGSTGGSGNIYGLDDINHMVSTGILVPGSPSSSLIYNEIVSGAMPPGTPLRLDEQKVIEAWIIGSSQSLPTPTPSPTPTPTPVPVPVPSPISANATFSYINKNIIQTRCIQCHSGMKTYTGVMRYVVAGSPQSSSLYTESYSGSMPRGASALGKAELKNLFDWIKAGAKNN